jgi:PAS domain S-box-containing protein
LKTADNEVSLNLGPKHSTGDGQRERGQEPAADALITAEARLHLAMRAANIGFWEWDVKTNAVYHSPEWKRQLGYEDHEVTNEIGEWQSRLHPEDQQRVQAAVENFLDQPNSDYDLEFRLRHRDGSYRWIRSQGSLLRDERGEPARLIGVHVDITNSKKRELELRQLAAIVESSNDAIIGEDLDGVITSWNKSAERIYGYTAGQAVGSSVRMLVPRERADEVTAILERMRRGEMIEHLETLRVRNDGRQIYISLVVSPIQDLTGRIIGASAIARDITERKRLEAEVLQVSEREQQRIARDLHDGLGQLLSGTVHLSTALELELAEQALPEAAEALRITELLNRAVADARGLARGLFPVRPEANGLMVALRELADQTRELFGVVCSLQCRRPVLVENNVAATHLYRIAQEAVTNALKHGKARRIQIVLSESKGRTRLAVRDNGSGVVKDLCSGKGIGIRIMEYRAGMIGGTLAIQPQPKRGISVVCTLPSLKTGLCKTKSSSSRREC